MQSIGHVSDFLEAYESYNLAGYNSGGYAYAGGQNLLKANEVKRTENEQVLQRRETMVEKIKQKVGIVRKTTLEELNAKED